MSVQLSPIGNAWQFFNANGQPLNAGTLTTYAAGTSTPQATFTDATGGFQNHNPITLGVDGRVPLEVWLTSGTAYKFVLADGLGNIIGTYDNITGIASALVQRDYLAGLVMSTPGGSSSLTVAAGMATDSTNTVSMALAASITKTTSLWSVGTNNGGLDAGSIANSTWYHFFLIQRPDTGNVDVVFSTSPTNPGLPANYNSLRRIGSAKTDGSAHWTAFVQDGDNFTWSTPVNDATVNNPGTAAVTRALTVPTGVVVRAMVEASISTPTFTIGGALPYNVPIYLSDLTVADIGPSIGTAADAYAGGNGTVLLSGMGIAIKSVCTNTSAQIRTRLGGSDGTTNLNIVTMGWIDDRGKNA